MNTVHFSSQTDLWATPQDFYDRLNAEFHFDLDPCAVPENAKCARFYTPEQDGLTETWEGCRVFMNPPYGRGMGRWIEKAVSSKARLVVALLPARTDTKWFHDFIYEKMEIRFIKGRLKFGNAKYNAPFPCMIVIMRDCGFQAATPDLTIETFLQAASNAN